VNVAFDEALRDTFGALKSFEGRVRDPHEFQHLKNWILASWPDTFDTVAESMRKLETLAEFDLPVDTWAKLRDAVQNLTADDLSRVAKQYLDPAHAQLVVLGDVPRFKADLDALGIAEVEVRKAH
jgi:zinc protease